MVRQARHERESTDQERGSAARKRGEAEAGQQRGQEEGEAGEGHWGSDCEAYSDSVHSWEVEGNWRQVGRTARG